MQIQDCRFQVILFVKPDTRKDAALLTMPSMSLARQLTVKSSFLSKDCILRTNRLEPAKPYRWTSRCYTRTKARVQAEALLAFQGDEGLFQANDRSVRK
jgi:hypothetical protein